VPISQEMRPGRTLKKAKKIKKERKESQRCDKSHICSDHPCCATPTKVVMWGGVLDIVNHAKFHQNQFRVLALRGVENCLFPMLYAAAYTTG